MSTVSTVTIVKAVYSTMLPLSVMVLLDYLSTFGSLTWYAKSWYRELLMLTVSPNFSNKMNKPTQQTVILKHRGTVKKLYIFHRTDSISSLFKDVYASISLIRAAGSSV